MYDTLRSDLLAYYGAHGRDLPWRRRRDPYGIWLSEIMLQQTRVETVRERYLRFVAEFPDVESLAKANEERVCEAWAGLGYYRRARNLHRAARMIVERGGWPTDAAGWRELPGVGAYTAGAVASIAFGAPEPAVDGNVLRVLARVFALRGRAGERALERQVGGLAAELVQGERPGDLNQALMDVGAGVCTPQAPRCSACPLVRHCRAHAQGDPGRYPGRARVAPRASLPMAFAWIETPEGVYLRRRPLDGLWAGLWELPSAAGPRARSALARMLGVELGERLAQVEHELTHRRVRASVFAAPMPPADRTDLVAYGEPLAAPLSALARKAIEAVLARRRPERLRSPQTGRRRRSS